MQIMADVLNMPIKIARSEQAPALGSAMLAAAASAIYSTTEEAQSAMGNGMDKEYFPIAENVTQYEKIYRKYSQLGEIIEQKKEQDGQV